ncbi:MAG: AtpZ/AtpI family protein [Ghiorsea sp.]
MTIKRTAGYQWALRVGTELVAATMLGLGIGFLLDVWLGTRPWFLLLFFLFGTFAGFLNLYRVISLDRDQHHER